MSDAVKYTKLLSDAAIAAGEHKKLLGGGAAQWEARGAAQLEFMRQQGLSEPSRLLDIGCGPGRAAVHFIAFLEANGYCGIDYNASFIRAADLAVEHLGLTAKAPRFEVIDDFEVGALGRRFDFALAFSVLNHCTAAQRSAFFPMFRRPS
ncbi:MAG: class I SAM-dependent methyltransferase [Devosia sp.]